ncbi:MAG: DUF692 domain-containing protein [Alphaproteobacteria bacterium]|nr:DUF692 domain-containing protein [Alphaproteobacteria bacterium]
MPGCSSEADPLLPPDLELREGRALDRLERGAAIDPEEPFDAALILDQIADERAFLEEGHARSRSEQPLGSHGLDLGERDQALARGELDGRDVDIASHGREGSLQQNPESLVGVGDRLALGAARNGRVGAEPFLEIDSETVGQHRPVARVPACRDQHGREVIERNYVDRVAHVVDTLGLRTYSEHLAFTRAGGIDTANLLPLLRDEAMAERIIERIRAVRTIVAVPFQLENITRYVDWPDSDLSEAAFFDLIRCEAGIGMLLDVESIRFNAANRGLDAVREADLFPSDAIAALHIAGGTRLDGYAIDSHDGPVHAETLSLLGHVLRHADPATVILERDGGYDDHDGIGADIERIRRVVAAEAGALA